jgi:hypothetical protein
MQELPRARQVLEPLGELGAGHALRHFGTGLRHLIAGEDGAALRELRTGLESGSGNPALDRDLGMLADALAALPGLAEPAAANAETDAGANADADADDASPWRHMLISAYTGKH